MDPRWRVVSVWASRLAGRYPPRSCAKPSPVRRPRRPRIHFCAAGAGRQPRVCLAAAVRKDCRHVRAFQCP
eukprot:11206742-Lingulodinium_polyedra.AAC.1